MSVYDVQGREVVRLVDNELDAGKHAVTWSGRDADGRKVASGVYWYLLQADNQVSRRKMVLLK
jgi:flagellar hook assembly protein FlgD